MMKRLISIFLLAIYALLSVGVSASQHFCGEYLAETQLFSSEKKTCQCSLLNAKKGTKSDCCHDEVKFVKLEMSQNLTKISSFNFLKILTAFAINPFEFAFAKNITSIAFASKQIAVFFLPPESALYLLFCVFRI